MGSAGQSTILLYEVSANWKAMDKGKLNIIYSSPDWMLVQTFKSVLESYGIACEVKDEFPIGTRERIAITELWVVDHTRVQEARTILTQSAKTDPSGTASWKCNKCGELIEEQFDQCWLCGKPW